TAQVGLAFQAQLVGAATSPDIGDRGAGDGFLDHVAGKVVRAGGAGTLPGGADRVGMHGGYSARQNAQSEGQGGQQGHDEPECSAMSESADQVCGLHGGQPPCYSDVSQKLVADLAIRSRTLPRGAPRRRVALAPMPQLPGHQAGPTAWDIPITRL